MSVQVSVHPNTEDTRVSIHDPAKSAVDGADLRITAFQCGSATIQFRTIADAYAWLAHCTAELYRAEHPSEVTA